MNCKPGDLAIVVGAEATPEMIGLIVKVIRPAIDGEPNPWGGRTSVPSHGWICEPTAATIPWRSNAGILLHVTWRAIDDRLLRPIRGDDEVQGIEVEFGEHIDIGEPT